MRSLVLLLFILILAAAAVYLLDPWGTPAPLRGADQEAAAAAPAPPDAPALPETHDPSRQESALPAGSRPAQDIDPAQLAGLVLDENGNPLAEAYVWLWRGPAPPEPWSWPFERPFDGATIADDAGRFRVETRWSINMLAAGGERHAPLDCLLVEIAEGREAAELILRSHFAAPVSGSFDGDPPRGAVIARRSIPAPIAVGAAGHALPISVYRSQGEDSGGFAFALLPKIPWEFELVNPEKTVKCRALADPWSGEFRLALQQQSK